MSDIKTFRQALDLLLSSNPYNRISGLLANLPDGDPFEKIAALDRSNALISSIDLNLQKKGLTSFVLLTRNFTQSAASMALYAGDVGEGLVVKLVPTDHLPDYGYTYPFVLAPYHREFVGPEKNIVIEFYPWVNMAGITQEDVERMRETLAANGLKFNNGDDAPKNVGRLRDSTLCILDIGAVSWVDNEPTSSRQSAQSSWANKLHDLYPIYESGEIPRQDEGTSFKSPPRQSANKTAAAAESPTMNELKNGHATYLQRFCEWFGFG